MAVSPARFERLLGSLDAAALAAFVADLWAARGWETHVEGAVVVARDGPHGTTERVLCLPRHRLGRPAATAESAADVLVTATDPRRVTSAHPGIDARVVGPRDLRAMVLYAIDRAAADRLLASHLGRLHPPWSGWRRRAPAPATLLAGALIVVAVLGVVTGATGSGWPIGTPATATPSSPGGGPVTSARDPITPVSVDRYPPGVGPDGVTDPDRLAAAHAEAMADYPYVLRFVHQGSIDLLHPDTAWAAARHRVHRVDGTRYRARVVGFTVTNETVYYEEFADRSDRYRRTVRPAGTLYDRTAVPTGGDHGVFTAVAAAYISRYLATTESQVEVVAGPYRPSFRVAATGTPTRVPERVANYTAVAVVDRRGGVFRLTVTYRPLDRHPAAGSAAATGDADVRFELSYHGVGRTTATAPAWYAEARNVTRGDGHTPPTVTP